MIAAGLPTPSGSGQRSLGRGPPDREAADLADGDLVLNYAAMAAQANFTTIGRPGIGKFERVELRLDPSRGAAVVKNFFLPGLVALALGTPAVAEAGPAVGGFLSFSSAIRFQKKYFPPVAPTLLRDNRARFFSTKRPIEVDSCKRVNRATVICSFSLTLNPDAAHRRAHWFPIRCRGKVRSRHRVDGSILGDVRNYTCSTIFPKK